MKIGNIGDVRVPVQAVLGENNLSISQISQLQIGSVVALDKLAGEPADLFAAGKKIAKGEVIVIDRNFGIRITGIVRPEGTGNE